MDIRSKRDGNANLLTFWLLVTGLLVASYSKTKKSSRKAVSEKIMMSVLSEFEMLWNIYLKMFNLLLEIYIWI